MIEIENIDLDEIIGSFDPATLESIANFDLATLDNIIGVQFDPFVPWEGYPESLESLNP